MNDPHPNNGKLDNGKSQSQISYPTSIKQNKYEEEKKVTKKKKIDEEDLGFCFGDSDAEVENDNYENVDYNGMGGINAEEEDVP